MPNDVVTRSPESFSLIPRTLEEAMKFSQTLAKSELVPKDFIDKPANILVAIQWGMELGLQPMQAMQSIAVINGRPSLWGDAVIGLVRASGLCEYIYENVAADGLSATCRTKRKGDAEEVTRTFTMEDAHKAGLKGKQGPWTNYPKRMLQMRARSWCLRDVYPDVLRGVHVAEESQDIPEKDITPTTEIPMPAARAEPAKGAPVDAEVVQPAGEKKADDKRPGAVDVEVAKAGASNGGTTVGTDFNTAASEGQIAHIRKKAKSAEISELEVCKALGIDTLDGISVGTGNMALAFLADPAAFTAKK